ncbi:hypothetical protein [Glutamicibacter sp. NPDC090743]|uniref:hypothetical protein n=1 Tax=Glutamicibacter sp. NPDC090743 TaxID=3364001 RepID=UPI0037F3E659
MQGLELCAGDRAATIFLLVFEQPLSRITALQVDQFEYSDDGRLSVTFKASPVEIPPPFDEIIKDFLASRMNKNTVANQNSSWCYTGYALFRVEFAVQQYLCSAVINSASDGCYAVQQEMVSHQIAVLVEDLSLINFEWCSEGIIA